MFTNLKIFFENCRSRNQIRQRGLFLREREKSQRPKKACFLEIRSLRVFHNNWLLLVFNVTVESITGQKGEKGVRFSRTI